MKSQILVPSFLFVFFPLNTSLLVERKINKGNAFSDASTPREVVKEQEERKVMAAHSSHNTNKKGKAVNVTEK